MSFVQRCTSAIQRCVRITNFTFAQLLVFCTFPISLFMLGISLAQMSESLAASRALLLGLATVGIFLRIGDLRRKSSAGLGNPDSSNPEMVIVRKVFILLMPIFLFSLTLRAFDLRSGGVLNLFEFLDGTRMSLVAIALFASCVEPNPPAHLGADEV